MSRKLWKPLAAIAAVAALAPAHAQMMNRPMPGPHADRERGSPPPQMAPPGAAPQRQEFVPPGRLSPEERRQLRRDIHDAGRELYRPNPQRQPP
ncbi:MAG: hypothetical protein PHY45_06280 [Rhodocyclaceae bacterium]|nr:hypothetical protein [Rhodocyclaceae bacterium]